MQNTNAKNVLLPRKKRKRKKKTQHDNLEVAFITNDQTFQLFNKQG